MSQRPGVVGQACRRVDPGKSPNSFIAAVTAQVRVHWPPHVSLAEIEEVLEEAVVDARRQLTMAKGGSA